MNTERKAWLEKRKFEVNELLSVTSSKYLIRTQKLILLDPYLGKMNDEWLAIKKAPPQGGLVNQFCVSQRDAPDGLENTVDEAAFDKFADYFHNKAQNCLTKLRNLTEQNQDSFQKLCCSTCKKKPAKIMHNDAPTCRHLVSCQTCSQGLRACPVCKIENKNLVMRHNAKCFGCSLETVDTYCPYCFEMKYCSSCASKVKNKKGKKKYKCSRWCRLWSGDLVGIRADDSQ